MRVFRFLAAGCVVGAVAVGGFTLGTWVARPKPAVTAVSLPATPPKPQEMPKAQDKASTVVRPVTYETPQSPRDMAPVPDLPKPGEFAALPPTPAGFGEAKLPPLPSPAQPAGAHPIPPPPLGGVGTLPPLPPAGNSAGFAMPRIERPEPAGRLPAPELPPVDKPAVPPLPKPAEPATQYVNKPDLAFDYEVTKQGKSGVKAVVLFAKPLPDTAWAEAAKAEVGGAERPKLAYTLPKEGRYGFRVGVSSGTVTATPPKATDEPEMVVVFDKTPPTIEWFKLMPTPPAAPHPNILAFQWRVTDANLAERPVFLEYQVPGKEQWAPIGERTGEYLATWATPNDVPATVRVRLTAIDRAGNTSHKVIEAVNTDHTVPRGRLTGVKAVEVKKPELPDLPPIPKSDEPK